MNTYTATLTPAARERTGIAKIDIYGATSHSDALKRLDDFHGLTPADITGTVRHP